MVTLIDCNEVPDGYAARFNIMDMDKETGQVVLGAVVELGKMYPHVATIQQIIIEGECLTVFYAVRGKMTGVVYANYIIKVIKVMLDNLGQILKAKKVDAAIRESGLVYKGCEAAKHKLTFSYDLPRDLKPDEIEKIDAQLYDHYSHLTVHGKKLTIVCRKADAAEAVEGVIFTEIITDVFKDGA